MQRQGDYIYISNVVYLSPYYFLVGNVGCNQTKTKSHSCIICSNKIKDTYQWQAPASSEASYENREFSQRYFHIVHQNCSSVKLPKKLGFFDVTSSCQCHNTSTNASSMLPNRIEMNKSILGCHSKNRNAQL